MNIYSYVQCLDKLVKMHFQLDMFDWWLITGAESLSENLQSLFNNDQEEAHLAWSTLVVAEVGGAMFSLGCWWQRREAGAF